MLVVLALLAAAAPAVAADTTNPTAVLQVPASVLPNASIHLVGGKSFDVSGTVVSYRWTVAGRPVVVTSASTFDAPGLTPGVYSVSLVVVDSSGNQSAADTKQLLVADTVAPTAVLDLPASPNPNATIHLVGSKSFDVGGSIQQYTWTVGTRLPVVTDTATFDAPGLPAGAYPVSLVVTDDSGNDSALDTRQLIVRDSIAPTAALAVPTASVFAGRSISLTAFKSFDVGGSVVQYRWTVAGRAPVVTDTPTFNAPGVAVGGTYPVSLVVVDDSGNESAPDIKQVVVTGDAAAPTAVLETPASASVGQTIHLVGSKSFDVGGSVVQYRWTVAGRAPVVTDTATFDATGLPAGAYPVSLVVTDDSGNDSAPDTQQLLVRDTVAPTASLDAPTTIVAGTAIHMTALKSFDVGGSIVQYRWTVGGRATQTTTGPSFDAPSLGAGTYTLSLVVTDDSGNDSAPVTRTLIVTPDAPEVTTFGKAALFAPVGKTTSQITLHTRTLIAGRIFSTAAGRLDATFSLARSGRPALALGRASLKLTAGGVQRLRATLPASALRALRGHRRVTVLIRASLRDGTSNTIIVARRVTFTVNR
jgi:PKD repeat protein